MVGIVAAPVLLLLGGGGAGGIDRAQGVGDDRAAQGRGAAPPVRGLRKLNAHVGSCRRGCAPYGSDLPPEPADLRSGHIADCGETALASWGYDFLPAAGEFGLAAGARNRLVPRRALRVFRLRRWHGADRRGRWR